MARSASSVLPALLAALLVAAVSPYVSALSSRDLVGVWTGSCVQRQVNIGNDTYSGVCTDGLYTYGYMVNYTMVNGSLMIAQSYDVGAFSYNGSTYLSGTAAWNMTRATFDKVNGNSTTACLHSASGTNYTYAARVAVTRVAGLLQYVEEGVQSAVNGTQTAACAAPLKKLVCNPTFFNYICTAYKAFLGQSWD